MSISPPPVSAQPSLTVEQAIERALEAACNAWDTLTTGGGQLPW